jgi:acylglycerol lipase
MIEGNHQQQGGAVAVVSLPEEVIRPAGPGTLHQHTTSLVFGENHHRHHHGDHHRHHSHWFEGIFGPGYGDQHHNIAAVVSLVVAAAISLGLYFAAKTLLKPYSSKTHAFVRTAKTTERSQRAKYEPPSSYFLNKDNLYIYHQTWVPTANEPPSAVVVFVHGVGEHCGRYDTFAKRMCAELGVAVVSLDHQGHGKSEGDRLFVVDFEDYVEDVMKVSTMAKTQFKDVPQYILGHSLGGLVAVRCVQKYPNQFTAAVFSAPALSVKASANERMMAPYLAEYLPHLPMNRVDPNLLSHDSCVVDLYCNDPLVSTSGVTARLGCEILDTIDKTLAWADEITLPYFLIRGDADQVALREGIVQFHTNTKSKDKTFTELTGLYHEIFNEVNTPAISMVIAWLKQRMSTA